MIQIFQDIKELVTLKRASQKQGRQAQEADLSVIKNGALVSYQGRILWVGPRSRLSSKIWSSLKKKSKVKEHSLKGMSVLPGFVESHTHLVFSGDRAHEFELRNQGVSYQEIAQKGGGIRSTMKSVRNSTEKELWALAQPRVNRFVQQGVTTLEIKSGYGLSLKSEIKMLEVMKKLKGPQIVKTFLGPHAVPPEFSSSAEYMDHLIQKMLPTIAKKKLADRVDMFIEKGYFTFAEGKRYLDHARQLGLRLALHTDQLTRTAGFQLLLQDPASVDHVVELNPKDIEKIASSPLTSVLLPAADFYLKTPYPKARSLIDQGARVALATDFNPGSSPTQDLSFIGVLARLEMKMTLPEVITAYTVGASYALGLEKEVGSLEKGKLCDFCTIEGSWRDLFYQVGSHPVQETWKSGKKLKFS